MKQLRIEWMHNLIFSYISYVSYISSTTPKRIYTYFLHQQVLVFGQFFGELQRVLLDKVEFIYPFWVFHGFHGIMNYAWHLVLQVVRVEISKEGCEKCMQPSRMSTPPSIKSNSPNWMPQEKICYVQGWRNHGQEHHQWETPMVAHIL